MNTNKFLQRMGNIEAANIRCTSLVLLRPINTIDGWNLTSWIAWCKFNQMITANTQ